MERISLNVFSTLSDLAMFQIMNQSLFEKIWIEEDGRVTTEFTNVYKHIAQPVINEIANHNTKKVACDESHATFITKLLKSYSNFFGKGLNNEFLVGLSEINSKNYKIILDKVKYAPLTSVPDSPEPTHSSNVNNIKTEIKQQQKYLSDEEIGEIVIKYKCGKSTYELAEEYGCHRYTISKHLKEAGIEVTNRVARKESLVGLMLQLYSEWHKPAEIAEALGISVDSVRRCLKENGVELRHSSEYARR